MAWVSQDSRSTLAIDRDALYASVQRKAALMDSQAAWMEVGYIFSGFFLALIFLLDILVHTWLIPNGELYQSIMSALLVVICLGLAVYALRGRRRRMANCTAIDRSMLENVRRAREQIDYYVQHADHLIKFYLLPLAALSIINLTFFADATTPWVWIGTLILCIFCVWETRRDLRERLEPEKRNLIYLRDKLLADGPG